MLVQSFTRTLNLQDFFLFIQLMFDFGNTNAETAIFFEQPNIPFFTFCKVICKKKKIFMFRFRIDFAMHFVCIEVKVIITILSFTHFFKHIAIILNTTVYSFTFYCHGLKDKKKYQLQAIEDFLSCLEMSAEECGLLLKKGDKKRERYKPFIPQHCSGIDH